jgi:hypothetical protein
MIQGRFRSRIRAALTSAAVLLPALAVTAASSPITASAATAASTRMISSGGTTSFVSQPLGTDAGVQNPEFRLGPSDAVSKPGTDVIASGGGAAGTGQGALVNAAVGLTFEGLFHRQQRLANGGNQYSVEPPDQGLCAGNGFVLETVNDVLRVFNYAGAPLTGVVALNTFYGYIPAINRTTGVPGPFVTDPSCYYDPQAQRWFHVVLTLDVDPATGAFLGSNHLDIAVSNSADPTKTWTIYRVAVQDDGTAGTPDHGCSTGVDKNGELTGHGPCIGDFPHLGADANGFYVTTNEYSLIAPDFHGAQIYAFSKRALASGAANVAVTQIDTNGMDRGNSGFTLAPATAPGGGNSRANEGTEFFLSSNAGDEAHGNTFDIGPRTSTQIIVWTLAHTATLNRAQPDLDLNHHYLNVGRYSFPKPSDQKAGSTPLADCLNSTSCSNFLLGPHTPKHESEYALDSSDTRMMQTTLASGRLFGALDTALNGKAGIEYFEVNVANEQISLARQGYLGLAGQNLSYPAIGVNGSGQGVMAFTVAGSAHYPSAGYATIDKLGVGAVNIIKEGLGPADGFSGYKAFNDPIRPRWGDYGAAAVVGNTIWIASEMINQTCTLAEYTTTPFGSCGGRRSTLANWSTEITALTVGA